MRRQGCVKSLFPKLNPHECFKLPWGLRKTNPNSFIPENERVSFCLSEDVPVQDIGIVFSGHLFNTKSL